jgi:putative transposase
VSLAGFIAAQRAEHGIPYATSCRAVGVSQAWFYKWVNGDVSLRRARRDALAAQIRYLFTKHKRRYGSPRITADVQTLGWRVSKNTIAVLMRELGLVARPKRRRGTTKADRSARKAPDLVGRDFSLRGKPNQVWVGDLTDIPNEEGPLYLASVLDLHSRRVVGFAMDAQHDTELARGALCMAIAIRGGEVAGAVFHTDQGGEYTGQLFATACAHAGVSQSMGRTGSALDNAVAESFHSTLEFELLRGAGFATRAAARAAVAGYLEEYNLDRRHSTCGMLSPVAYEHTQAEAAA